MNWNLLPASVGGTITVATGELSCRSQQTPSSFVTDKHGRAPRPQYLHLAEIGERARYPLTPCADHRLSIQFEVLANFWTVIAGTTECDEYHTPEFAAGMGGLQSLALSSISGHTCRQSRPLACTLCKVVSC
jgi:hypothetical protein